MGLFDIFKKKERKTKGKDNNNSGFLAFVLEGVALDKNTLKIEYPS